MKLLFVGYGRCGKDTAAKYLAKITGHRYAGSTSWAALPDIARLLNLHPMEAWETRHENRQLWKDLCDGLRVNDPAVLMRRSLATGDFTAGCRDLVELQAARRDKIFDRIIWIDRPGTPVDPTVTFDASHCDMVIRNAGTLAEFYTRLTALVGELGLSLLPGFLPAVTCDLHRE